MQFELDESQKQLQDVLRAVLASPARVDSPGAEHARHWSTLANDIGVFALGLPEEHGGTGETFFELSILFEELGRSLARGPYLSTLGFAASALIHSGDDAGKAEYLPRIADGSLIATTVFGGDSLSDSIARRDTTAILEDGSWLISGAYSGVRDAETAQLILVVAPTPDGSCLFAVRTDSPTVQVSPDSSLDPTSSISLVTIDSASGRLIGTVGDADRLVERAIERSAILSAAMDIGVARACLSSAVEYSKVRSQFGRPIGSFQAIKHLLAELHRDIEAAAATVEYAAWAVDGDPHTVSVLASICKPLASDAAWAAASKNIQVLGGIGFTAEHDAHLYFKRATVARMTAGSPAEHRERLAKHILRSSIPEE